MSDAGSLGAPSATKRCRVLPNAVSWNVSDPDYSPIEAEFALASPPPPEPRTRPLNPLGRTGATGLGALPRWGPVLTANCLLTRFKTTGGASSQLEMLAVSTLGSHFSLPVGLVESESPEATMRREVHLLVDAEDEATRTRLDVLMARVARNVVYTGPVEDPRNTDNAWLETVAAHVHIEDERLGAGLPAAPDADWIPISNEDARFQALLPSHREILISALRKRPAEFAEALAELIDDSPAAMVSTMFGHLEARIDAWHRRVEDEREAMALERQALDAEKLSLKKKMEVLSAGVEELAASMKATEEARAELKARLAQQPPLNLTDEELRAEWAALDEERAHLAEASAGLEKVYRVLKEAQAAADVALSQQEGDVLEGARA